MYRPIHFCHKNEDNPQINRKTDRDGNASGKRVTMPYPSSAHKGSAIDLWQQNDKMIYTRVVVMIRKYRRLSRRLVQRELLFQVDQRRLRETWYMAYGSAPLPHIAIQLLKLNGLIRTLPASGKSDQALMRTCSSIGKPPSAPDFAPPSFLTFRNSLLSSVFQITSSPCRGGEHSTL